MKQTIFCKCDKTFDVTVPDVITLDTATIASIADSSFMNYTCPHCGHITATEFSCILKNEKSELYFLPELERFSFFNGVTEVPKTASVVIGFPELKERIAIMENQLDANSVEALKIIISEKVATSTEKFEVYFTKVEDTSLVFHISGLKEDEIAVIKLPVTLYETMKETYQNQKNEPPYSLLFRNGYCSVKNIDFGE